MPRTAGILPSSRRTPGAGPSSPPWSWSATRRWRTLPTSSGTPGRRHRAGYVKRLGRQPHAVAEHAAAVLDGQGESSFPQPKGFGMTRGVDSPLARPGPGMSSCSPRTAGRVTEPGEQIARPQARSDVRAMPDTECCWRECDRRPRWRTSGQGPARTICASARQRDGHDATSGSDRQRARRGVNHPADTRRFRWCSVGGPTTRIRTKLQVT